MRLVDEAMLFGAGKAQWGATEVDGGNMVELKFREEFMYRHGGG